MAQKSKARSDSSTGGSKPAASKSRKSSAGGSRKRSTSSRSQGSSKSTKRSRGSKSSSGAGARVGNARHSVEEKAKDAGQSVGGAAKGAGKSVGGAAKDAGQAVGGAAAKARLPLVASGAALAGMAGGLAVGMRRSRRRPRLQAKLRSRDLAHAAREVGSFGAQMGHLASELQRSREGANGSRQRRSPVEVVLDGLTTRRS